MLDWHGIGHAVLVGPNSDAPGFVEPLRWGQHARAAVELSGWVKVSQQSCPHPDLLPMVEDLVAELGPDHRVWASDQSFLRMPDRVYYGPLLALPARKVPDEDDRRAILWDTPRRAYGFASR